MQKKEGLHARSNVEDPECPEDRNVPEPLMVLVGNISIQKIELLAPRGAPLDHQRPAMQLQEPAIAHARIGHHADVVRKKRQDGRTVGGTEGGTGGSE